MGERRALTVPVEHADLGEVSALLDLPEEAAGEPLRSGLLLAHGAGAPMTSAFLESVATGLAQRGLPVLRFQYAYAERALREGRRRPPDRRPTLLAVHRAAIECARAAFGERPLLLGGKSMGGRMASLLATEGVAAAGLVLFGYPLHPAGRPTELRSEHLPAIPMRSLFLQGTRDALCDLELLREALVPCGDRARLEVVEGADHDFRVLKRSGRTDAEVLEQLLDAVDGWERAR